VLTAKVRFVHLPFLWVDVVGKKNPPPLSLKRQPNQTDAREEFDCRKSDPVTRCPTYRSLPCRCDHQVIPVKGK
jgi:hypothetical protein